MNGGIWLDSLAPINWPTLMLVTARVAGLLMVAPVWSIKTISPQIRGSVAVLLGFFLLPGVETVQMPNEALALPVMLCGEMLFGVVLGITAGLFVNAMRLGAEVVSVQMGLAIARTLLPGSGESSTTIGQLQSLMALAMYLALGGHIYLFVGLETSLHAIPPGTQLDFVTGGSAFISALESVFSTAMRVAAPIMVAMVMTNLALAILGKAVPQVHVLMFAFPITISVGLFAFGATLPFLASLVNGWVESLPNVLDGMIGSFVPEPVG